MSTLAVVIHGVLGLRGLRERLELLCRQSRRPDRVLVLDPGGLAGQLRSLSHPLHPEFEPELVSVSLAAPPGKLRNAGLRAADTDAVLFLEPGFLLAERYCDRALDALATGRRGFVSSLWRRVGPSGAVETVTPVDCGLDTLLASPEAVHRAAVFWRAACEQIGGFDPTLPALEDLELCLRLLQAGWPGGLIDEPLVTAEARKGFPLELQREHHVQATTAIFHKHRAAFESRAAVVLVARERELLELYARHRSRLARRESARAELDALKQEAAELTLGTGEVEWGDLRRTTPIDPEWGYGRGEPIDRHYIEDFLRQNADAIQGHVLEVQDDTYARRFGGGRLKRVDVVDIRPENPRSTMVADLRRAEALPAASYDCIILTQTLHVIDDAAAVLRECYRLLRPGGVLLLTLPCLGRVCLEYGPDGDFWRVTEAGASRLVGSVFPPTAVQTRTYGNVLAATAFLYGLASHEVSAAELDVADPHNPVLVGVRAARPGQSDEARAAAGSGGYPGLILMYHGVQRGGAPTGLTVEVGLLRQHLAYLVRHAHVMGLGELVERAGTEALPERAVALTFDDGYAEMLSVVSPMLVELNLPATFFVITSLLATGQEAWWDVVEHVLLAGPRPTPVLELDLLGKPTKLVVESEADALSAWRAIHDAVLGAGVAEREEILRQLHTWSGAGRPRPRHTTLTDKQLVELSRRPGHTIGAHSVHHLALGRQSFETQQEEVMESKVALERLGLAVEAFAYPFGDVGDGTIELVRAAGYRMAVTTEQQAVRPRPDPFRLPRLEVRQGPIEELTRRLRRWW
jgi:peptidoglycan/xylan/chitin deacetylase (PgdA/CDA1 family)/SAM-dependent methyltransferase